MTSRRRYLYSHPALYNRPARPFSMRVEPVSPVDSEGSGQPDPEETRKLNDHDVDQFWLDLVENEFPEAGAAEYELLKRFKSWYNERIERGN